MSFRTPLPKKKDLPFQSESVATNQQSIPLPYIRGSRLVAVRWISPAFNRIVLTVKGQGKKG